MQPLPFLYESTGIITRFTVAATPSRVRARYSVSPGPKRSRMAGSRRQPARALAAYSAAEPRPSSRQGTAPARLPGNRHRQSGSVIQGRPTSRPDPDGDRLRQDLYRHHLNLPPAEIRAKRTRPVPGRYQEPRRTGRAGVHVLHADRR